MTTFRVDCHTPDNADLDRRIQGLGGTNPISWWYPIDTIIQMIQRGDVFYVMVNEQVVLVIVKRHPVSQRLFLTTEPDGYTPNNLLNLPYCP